MIKDLKIGDFVVVPWLAATGVIVGIMGEYCKIKYIAGNAGIDFEYSYWCGKLNHVMMVIQQDQDCGWPLVTPWKRRQV